MKQFLLPALGVMLLGVVCISEVLLAPIPFVVDCAQNVAYMLSSVLVVLGLYPPKKENKDPLNTSSLEKELLEKEKSQLEQKIKTLESALTRAMK